MSELIARYSALYRCRYGYRGGVQACVFIGYEGDRYLVRKWQRKSETWTDQIAISKEDLLGRMPNKEARELKVNRLLLKIKNPGSRKVLSNKVAHSLQIHGAV